MKRIIKSMENAYLLPALELVEDVFTKHENAEEGKLRPTATAAHFKGTD